MNLVGAQRMERGSTIMLNPGARHTLAPTDTLFYLSITREEQASASATKDNHHDDDSDSKGEIGGFI